MTISEDDKIIIDIMSSTKIITGMMSANEIYGILKYLQYVLKNDIPGEIIEFGCFVGTVSIFIRKMLDKYNIAKQVTNYNELSKNLIKDLNSQSKINNSMSKPIKILGQKTFIDTMKLVDNFLINDNQ